MTAGFPLSVNDLPDARGAAPTPTVTTPLDALHDGSTGLRRRGDSRLWFRMSDPAAPVEMRPPCPPQAPTSPAKSTQRPGTDKLVSEMVRVVRAGRHALIDADGASRAPDLVAMATAVTPTTHAQSVVTITSAPASSAAASVDEAKASDEKVEWRAVQAGAPVLLLSAGPVLESSKPGPILGPGMRYRILGMTGSVVEMEVMHANGDTRRGYANAVDLRCIEPKIHTGELRTEKGLTGRLRLTKLATTTFGLFGG